MFVGYEEKWKKINSPIKVNKDINKIENSILNEKEALEKHA